MHSFCWLFFSLLYTPFASCYKFPFQDPKLPWDERVNDLVDRLTVEEMVNQSLSVYGVLPPAIERLNVSAYMFNTECLHGYVSRNATAFPQSISLAATFRYCMIWSYEWWTRKWQILGRALVRLSYRNCDLFSDGLTRMHAVICSAVFWYSDDYS